MENLEEFSDQLVVKGKRTKRPRHSSSASSSGGALDFNSYNSFLSVSSPTTSTSTAEEEDMANCLILLARGGRQEDDKKSENRKFAEITTSAAAKVGGCVYECKTCSRSFTSFQALGGHRASHKKPKLSTSAADQIDQKKPRSDDDQSQDEGGKTVTKPSCSVSPKLVDITKPRIHECSICGSEFASGQALGGHMRRHRPATTGRNANDSPSEDAGDNSRHVFELDLNLPAPPEADLVFSAVSLVDCHY